MLSYCGMRHLAADQSAWIENRLPPSPSKLMAHEFHYTKLRPGEAELIDAQLIRDTRLAGTPRNWSSASVTRNATARRS
jgi:hypothetical protein